jgi:hypothetical protein
MEQFDLLSAASQPTRWSLAKLKGPVLASLCWLDITLVNDLVECPQQLAQRRD